MASTTEGSGVVLWTKLEEEEEEDRSSIATKKRWNETLNRTEREHQSQWEENWRQEKRVEGEEGGSVRLG